MSTAHQRRVEALMKAHRSAMDEYGKERNFLCMIENRTGRTTIRVLDETTNELIAENVVFVGNLFGWLFLDDIWLAFNEACRRVTERST